MRFSSISTFAFREWAFKKYIFEVVRPLVRQMRECQEMSRGMKINVPRILPEFFL